MMGRLKGIPTVSAIIERRRGGVTEVLVQTRWKPHGDPTYSGTLEIPAGAIERYEDVYHALKREVFEETGLRVATIRPEIKTRRFSPKRDASFAFVPFCCNQQIKGGKPWIGFVFVCEVKEGKLKPQKDEVKDVLWMKRSDLKKIFKKNPKRIFTFQLGVLEHYFNRRKG